MTDPKPKLDTIPQPKTVLGRIDAFTTFEVLDRELDLIAESGSDVSLGQNLTFAGFSAAASFGLGLAALPDLPETGEGTVSMGSRVAMWAAFVITGVVGAIGAGLWYRVKGRRDAIIDDIRSRGASSEVVPVQVAAD